METARKALSHSRTFIAQDLVQSGDISTSGALEHLIVQTGKSACALLDSLDNAGSIFLGAYSPESMGDYASGTNHSHNYGLHQNLFRLWFSGLASA